MISEISRTTKLPGLKQDLRRTKEITRTSVAKGDINRTSLCGLGKCTIWKWKMDTKEIYKTNRSNKHEVMEKRGRCKNMGRIGEGGQARTHNEKGLFSEYDCKRKSRANRK